MPCSTPHAVRSGSVPSVRFESCPTCGEFQVYEDAQAIGYWVTKASTTQGGAMSTPVVTKTKAGKVNPKTGFREGTFSDTLGTAYLDAGGGDAGKGKLFEIMQAHNKSINTSRAADFVKTKVGVFLWTARKSTPNSTRSDRPCLGY